jgi:hypothetical protein
MRLGRTAVGKFAQFTYIRGARMSDPRLNGDHLSEPRFNRYRLTVDEMLDGRGPFTAAADEQARPPALPHAPARHMAPTVSGTYSLVSIPDGYRYPLRVGINALGRLPENDLVLGLHGISRRHCVVLVHATGGCEVYDLASRNGTWVNGRRVDRVDLLPGDVLALVDQKFLVEWAAPQGEPPWPGEGPDTFSIVGPSPRG